MIATRGKVVGYSSHGTAPKPIVYASAEEEKDKEPQIFRLVFDIHDFADNIPTRLAWALRARHGEIVNAELSNGMTLCGLSAFFITKTDTF